MSVNYMECMKMFHKVFDVPIANHPTMIKDKDFIRRLTLITSEVGEVGDAIRKKDIIEIADALGDILYVTFGMAVEMGLDMDRIFHEIHLSNMSKANEDGTITKDAGGKVLKSKNYHPVDLSWIKYQEGEDTFDCFGDYNPSNRGQLNCQECTFEKYCKKETETHEMIR